MIPLEIDPPEHVKYRQILAPMFGTARTNKLEDYIRSVATELIDSFIERGSCEFVSEFAQPLPTKMFLALMGWPAEDSEMFFDWADMIIRGVPGDEEASQKGRAEAGLALYTYFGKMIAVRAEKRGDDIVSMLLDASYGGERSLTQFEILDIIFLLLIAGLDTTKSVLANGILYLAENPKDRQRLVEDPSLIPSAIEELLRWESPIVPGRRVTRDVVMRGVQFREGDRVMLLTGSTGRDEQEFPNAGEFDMTRHPNRHLAFGAGVHRCVGSNLARLELRVAFEEIHRRMPDYLIAQGHRPKRHLGGVRGVDELQLEFTKGS